MSPVHTKRNFFYKRITIDSEEFPEGPHLDFEFEATSVIISNDSTLDGVAFSFLPDNIDGELFCSDGPLVMDGLSEGRMWFKIANSDNPVQVRVWAWRT